jgi:hypothetical protein
MIRGLGIRMYRFKCTLGAGRVFGFLLQEDGYSLLQENGDQIILE